ncbi:hypothetical protein ILT44_13490 [Microvirga sp. BT689]|uniref:hypothetical protein n=1 Tax=Microvirga arvi TaxID=2778731 RepID=UPI00195125A6|nr:hypothetical protein [Microvirga arvi]MBM6581203.1 hypothetical protein [Microvirga arvi]
MKALLITWAVRCDDWSFILDHKVQHDGYIPSAWEVDRQRVQVVGSFDVLEHSDVVVSVDGELVPVDPSILPGSYSRPKVDALVLGHDAADELRRAFGKYRLSPCFLRTDGSLVQFGYRGEWYDRQCLQWFTNEVISHYDPKYVSIVVRFSELKQYLTRDGFAEPLVRVSPRIDLPAEEQDDIQAPSDPLNAVDSSKASSERVSPQRVRVERVLRTLYPDGIPGRDIISDTKLHQEVIKLLEFNPPSIWTIRRAAGRA